MARRNAAPERHEGMPRPAEAFLRRLTAGVVALFGLGTVLSNGAMLFLVTPEGRAQVGPIPLPLLWFDFLAGWAYLAATWGIALRRPWVLPLAWALAIAHALAASGVWLWFFAGHPVNGSTLGLVLAREAFWVLIGLYLLREPPAARR